MTDNAPRYESRDAYVSALKKFDAAICEAIAVSQASANRMTATHWGYASYVYAQLCSTGVSLVRAAPMSRWVQSDFQHWTFGNIAGYARALLDGYLLFSYLIEPTESEAELETRVCVMHLNDCTRRIELHRDVGAIEDIEGFEQQRTELREKLAANSYFAALDPKLKRNCLSGNYLMTDSRDERVQKIGIPKGTFDALYDLWSQHVHILPLSFYRMEPNGRGTGLENAVDRSYMVQALELCAALLEDATDSMVLKFPDVAGVRHGINSEFSPGPRSNLPRRRKPGKPPTASPPKATETSSALSTLFTKPK